MSEKVTRRDLFLGALAAGFLFTPVAMASDEVEDFGDNNQIDETEPPKIKKKKKRKSPKEKRLERKRKAIERRKARAKEKAARKARRRAKYRRTTGKQLAKDMPTDRNFGSLKGPLAKDIDAAKTRKLKAKVARKYSKIYKDRGQQIQGRNPRLASKYKSFARKLGSYSDAQLPK